MNAEQPQPTRRSRWWPIAAAVVLALLCYAASPYISFWRFTTALRAGNRDAIASHVDFPQLRDSMKHELRARFFPPNPNPKPKKDRLSKLLQGMAPNIIDALVDAYVTPDGIAALLADPHISLATKPENVGVATPASGKYTIDFSNARRAYFTGLKDFAVEAKEMKLRFRFNGTGWLLREIDLPLGETPAR